MQDYREYLEEILIDEVELQKRIIELAEEINRDYKNEKLHLICILRGGIVFLTDLMRQLTVPNTIDFMAVSSYGVARQSTGNQRCQICSSKTTLPQPIQKNRKMDSGLFDRMRKTRLTSNPTPVKAMAARIHVNTTAAMAASVLSMKLSSVVSPNRLSAFH